LRAYDSLVTFSGSLGGSRLQVHQQDVQDNLEEARSTVHSMRENLQSLDPIIVAVSTSDLDLRQATMWQQLQTLRVISENLNREYAGIHEQNLAHYQKRVGIPG
jgi:predicted  nucleic acid-binding Zn-ribbon protein